MLGTAVVDKVPDTEDKVTPVARLIAELVVKLKDQAAGVVPAAGT
jgi:hypothetical protein